MGHQLVGLDPAKIEALAARQDGDGDLADLGGGEDEFRVRRRLLQRLQEGVERLLGQHVDLVDDVDLVSRRDRRIADAIDDLANVVDAGMRRRIHLEHVHMPRFHDGFAMDAQVRHVDRRRAGAVGLLVIETPGQNARRRGFADASNACEHPGLRDAAGLERIRQGADHRLLADQILERAGAVFAGQNPIGRAGCGGRLKRKARQGRLFVQGRAGCGFVHRLKSFGIKHEAPKAPGWEAGRRPVRSR